MVWDSRYFTIKEGGFKTGWQGITKFTLHLRRNEEMTWFNILKRQEDIQADIVSFLVETLDIPLEFARQQVGARTIDENMKFANWLSSRMQSAMPQEKFMQIAQQGNSSRKIDAMYDYISGNLPPSQRERDEQFQQRQEDREMDSRIEMLGQRGAMIEQRRKDKVAGKKEPPRTRRKRKTPSAYGSGQLARRASFLARNKGNKSPQGKAARRRMGWSGESWKE